MLLVEEAHPGYLVAGSKLPIRAGGWLYRRFDSTRLWSSRKQAAEYAMHASKACDESSDSVRAFSIELFLSGFQK